ncbi:MAG TPA: biotin carboxylase N-terminal domain-containing protein [Chloroflexota bacterium]|nr:biotin carboxylase N-terminal domain-containing protein [Chloroflexota bacterium]
MIERLLIANRGEIAVRVMRTCQRLGVRTIAVYSDADGRAPHVASADWAVRIGGSPAAQSYLNLEAILDAARQTRATAIHPGYGFLSESADFAQAAIDAGFIWVGPAPAAMRALGDKARARALAERLGVPLLPGYHGDDQSLSTLGDEAERIGYPVLIKAAAGGGGRGMRVVDSAQALASALEAARREAVSSFGDERVLLERYVRRPRHIEMQIFGDERGQLVHLGERECSIQRRHQKLIEESPSPAVDADLRMRLADAALRLARAAGYTNAGTVEFLLDEDRSFAFLEVNARLQVEHPVTEAITGLDLVEWQLRVAAGEPLPLAQDEIAFDGHAIEVRVIAEDALAGFLPSSGTIEHFASPAGVRVDTWIDAATVVSPYYDSLLAKVVAYGSTRQTAAERLGEALRQTWIDGVANNVDLLLAIVEHPAFLASDLHTGFVDEQQVVESLREVPATVLAAVSALDALWPSAGDDPWLGTTTWRLGRLDEPATWARAGRDHPASVSAALDGRGVDVRVGDDVLRVTPLGSTDADVNVGRKRVSVQGAALTVWDHDNRRMVEWQHRSYRFGAPRPLAVEHVTRELGASGAPGRLSAPMPARIVKLAVVRGDHVTQNQPLVVLEAMKMEHVLEAPHAGVIVEICVAVGDQVQGGAQLIVLGPPAEPSAAEQRVE